MKTRKQYIKLCCLAGLALLVSSCSDNRGIDPQPEPQTMRVAMSPEVRSGYSTGTLQFAAYIFQSPAGDDDFTLVSAISLFVSGSMLDIPVSELEQSDYRFFFVALPESIVLPTVIAENGGTAGTGLSVGCEWDNVRFTHPGSDLNADYYYGVTEISGEDIISAGEVSGTLERLVGQMVYDIFKTGGSIDDPEGVPEDADVTSVLDRVYMIEVAYEGVTQSLMFDGTALVPDLSAATETFSEEISGSLIDFDVTTAHVTPGVKSSGTVIESYLPENADASLYTGAIRIRGAYLLPATNGVKATITFHYYDTTQICGNSDSGAHTLDGCYPKETLTLNLPATGSLAIRSNYFTANKAGIPCNRVIDIPVTGKISIDATWDTSLAVPPVNPDIN